MSAMVGADGLANLMRITVAADALEAFLTSNVGSNADWPVELAVDSDYSPQLVELLNNLQDALKPYREAKKRCGG